MSTDPPQMVIRPPIAAIVEGHGEYFAYQSLIPRILGVRVHIPVLRARGGGQIIADLALLLDQLVRTGKPAFVIVSLDLRENVGGRFASCQELRVHLQRIAEEWLRNHRGKTRYEPLPQRIEIVLQVQQFETWLIADCEGLVATGCFPPDLKTHVWTDADAAVPNPGAWIQQKQIKRFDPKNPATMAAAFRAHSIDRMERQSRSFRKFRKEIMRAYRDWDELCRQ